MLSLLALLSSLLSASAEVVPVKLERGHVIVVKRLTAPLTQGYLVKGHPFTVTYSVINLGAECVGLLARLLPPSPTPPSSSRSPPPHHHTPFLPPGPPLT